MALKKLLTLAFCVATVICIVKPLRAADHNDAPDIKSAEGLFVDLTDVFAFRSPTNPENFVLYAGNFTPEVAGQSKLFTTSGRYEMYVDTDSDFVADVTIRATFDDNDDGTQDFLFTGVPGANRISGIVSNGNEPNVVVDGPAKAFAGLRGDNFFFDLVGFQMFTAAPCIPVSGLRCPGTGAPADFFLGRNIAALAVEFPITALPGITSSSAGKIHVWAKTFTDS